MLDGEPLPDFVGGEDQPRRRFIIGRKTGSKERRRAFIGEGDAFHHQLGARAWLDAQSFREKTFLEHSGDEPGVDHGRFSHARFAVEKCAAVNRD